VENHQQAALFFMNRRCPDAKTVGFPTKTKIGTPAAKGMASAIEQLRRMIRTE
jgi:hypothetical protein